MGQARRIVLLTAAAALLLGCSSENGTAAPPPRPAPPPRRVKVRSAFGFKATTLEGREFDFAEANARRRLVVYLFQPTAKGSLRTTLVAQRLHDERHAYNLEVVGVAVLPGYTPLSARRIPRKRESTEELAELARRHLKALGATFPCVVDPEAEIVERYTMAWGMGRLDELPALYPFEVGSTRSVRPVFSRHAAKSPEPAAYLHRRVLRRFGIETTADVEPLVGHHPEAPKFTLTDTEGKTHRLADFAGRVLMVVFMARDCPRCKDELVFLRRLYDELGPGTRKSPPWLDVVVVCTDTTGQALARLVVERGYKFPVCSDADWKVRGAFGYRGAVPDTFVIDAGGRVRSRHRGFTLALPPLLAMEARMLMGLETRPLLERGSYTGDGACRICHEREHADWALTRHACAWETLVRLGKEDDPGCALCHVVGHGQYGGFVSARRTPHLTDVQCESCHGRNGCAAFHTDRKAAPVARAACEGCHDAVHSPRFDFATYRKRILHNRYEELAKLPRAEREARLRRLCSGSRGQVFDADAPYVGSATCGKCHPTELKALQGGFHERALATLARPGRDHWSVPRHKRGVVGIAKPACIHCHVTGHGRPGGFPERTPAKPLAHPLAGVGCEACHGPGKAHADDPKKPRAIARLGGTCPECNVLPICRQCHDATNAPHFNYEEALPKAVHPVGKAVSPP